MFGDPCFTYDARANSHILYRKKIGIIYAIVFHWNIYSRKFWHITKSSFFLHILYRPLPARFVLILVEIYSHCFTFWALFSSLWIWGSQCRSKILTHRLKQFTPSEIMDWKPRYATKPDFLSFLVLVRHPEWLFYFPFDGNESIKWHSNCKTFSEPATFSHLSRFVGNESEKTHTFPFPILQ